MEAEKAVPGTAGAVDDRHLIRGQVLVRFGPTIPVRLGFDLGSFSRCVRGTKLVFPDFRAFSWMGYFEFVDLNWAIQ